MRRFTADSQEMDHVTILLARVCAARLDANVTAEDFVRSVARLVDVAVTEAEERWQEERGGVDLRAGAGGTDSDDDESSTGAAAAETIAEQPKPLTHAAETIPPAAPVPPIAEPASPPSECGGDAGTPPAGDGAAGGEESQRKRKRLTPQQLGELRAAYWKAIRDSDDGELPPGWIARQADAMKLSYQTVYGRVQVLKGEEPERAPPSTSVSAPSIETETRVHTNSHSCWCRRSTCSTKNPWCKIAQPVKPVGSLAGLQDAPRRVERYLRGAS